MTLIILFFVHGRQREDEREKRLQYWREQVNQNSLDFGSEDTHLPTRRMPSAKISCKCTRQLATLYSLLQEVYLDGLSCSARRRRTPICQCYNMRPLHQKALGYAIILSRTMLHTRVGAITSTLSCRRPILTTGFERRRYLTQGKDLNNHFIASVWTDVICTRAGA